MGGLDSGRGEMRRRIGRERIRESGVEFGLIGGREDGFGSGSGGGHLDTGGLNTYDGVFDRVFETSCATWSSPWGFLITDSLYMTTVALTCDLVHHHHHHHMTEEGANNRARVSNHSYLLTIR